MVTCKPQAFVLVCLFFSFFANAEDPPILMDSWIIDIKNDQRIGFETALKSHLYQRSEADEPRDWWVYTPVTGGNMNRYIIRSCCHTWKSFDQQREWQAEHLPDQSWVLLLDQYANNYSHKVSKVDFPNSHWPKGLLVPKLIGITEYQIIPGHDGAFQAAKTNMSQLAIAGEWKRGWLWVETVTGENIETLMVLHSNFSDVAPLKQGVFEVLSQQLGSELQAEQLFDELFSHVSEENYQIYQARPDLFAVPE